MANIETVKLPNGNEYNIKDAISGYALQSEMSITDGSGADADKKTIQLKSGTSATVLTTHQSITGKADIQLLAPVETTATASRAYAMGDQFVYNGVLYRATAAIAQGGTISVGGNCSITNACNEIPKHKTITATTDATLGVPTAGIAGNNVLIVSLIGLTENAIIVPYKYTEGWSFYATDVITHAPITNRTLSLEMYYYYLY